jgi:hypothetical protein
MYYTRTYWGPIAWYLLHSFSINKNLKINEDKKHNYYIFYISFIYILPCSDCSDHYTDIIYNTNPLEESKITRNYLKKWVFNTHNIVNSIIGKKKYKYSDLIENYKIVNNCDIFFFIKNVYENFDYINMSYFNFDHIYNFFINFCILYPVKYIRIKLKKLIKHNNFTKIQTPIKFKEWFDNIIPTLNDILCNHNDKKDKCDKNK